MAPDDTPKETAQRGRPDDAVPAGQSADSGDQGRPVPASSVPFPTAVTPVLTQRPNPTAAVAEKPLTGAERAQVVRQIADGVGTISPRVVTNGQEQMTLQLHPKEWGDLRVTVQLAPAQAIDGVKQTTVVAHVVASSPAVKAALDTQSADLNHALRQTGLHLVRLTVTVQAPGAGAQSGSAMGGDRSFGSNSRDQWPQDAQPKADVGNGGLGGGGSSSFTSFSERQGNGPYQSRSVPGTMSQGIEEGVTDVSDVSRRFTGRSAGFDQRV